MLREPSRSLFRQLYDNEADRIVYSDLEKANLLNDYFCSISSVVDNNANPPNIPLRTQESLSNIEISVQDIKDILKTLKLGKASGDDKISHQMLKGTADSVCIPLRIIFNFSLRSGKFPSVWKLARVMPSFKKEDKSNPTNYRPISLLSCVGKVMERSVYKYI